MTHYQRVLWIVTTLCTFAAGTLSASAAEPAPPQTLAELARNLKAGESITQDGMRITMHQRDAGVVDKDGWISAKSSEGGFSVRFPAPFNDATMSGKTPDGVLVRMHVLASAKSDGTRFVLNCFERADLKSPDEAVNSYVEDMQRNGTKFKAESFSRGAITGKQFHGIDANGGHFAGQVFVAQGQLCQFMTEFAAGASLELPEEIRRSFDSFKPGANPSR